MVRAAIMRRIGAARTTGSTGTWGAAASAVGVLTAVLMLGIQTRPVVAAAVWSWRFAEHAPTTVIGATGWARLAGWALVVAALAAGWRRAATGAACAVAVADLAVLAIGIGTPDPGWQLLLGVVVAILLAGSAPSQGRRGRFPGRVWVLLFAMGASTALAAAGAPLVAHRSGNILAVDTGTLAGIGLGTIALVALLSVSAMLLLPTAGRHRVLVLLATVAVLLATMQLGYDNAFASAVPGPALIGSPALALVMATTTATTVLTIGAFAIRHEARTRE
ncbi:hypothetical protein ABT336_08180 [Micromonospora sp. NPDC000207]|uniref:hypothetical protein n=1 Tax=Micromonospora sp. NPDC000207 TaxID=3154246 RepID=UPI00332D9AC0